MKLHHTLPVMIALGLFACGSTSHPDPDAPLPANNGECKPSGGSCRVDAECCSRRCNYGTMCAVHL